MIPPLPSTLIAQIMETVLASPFRAVHYIGGADEGLLRSLLAYRGRLEVTVMDMPDRWGTGACFWWEEGSPEPPSRPDWLEGIPFYQEGAADHDILLRDWAWDYEGQLAAMVAFTGRRPPKLTLLFGQAELYAEHPEYAWETKGELRIGRSKENPGAFPPDKKVRDAVSVD